jgi:hypothetical protein
MPTIGLVRLTAYAARAHGLRRSLGGARSEGLSQLSVPVAGSSPGGALSWAGANSSSGSTSVGSAVVALSLSRATVGCPLSALVDPGALPAASVCVSWLPAASAASELSVGGVVEPASASPDADRSAGAGPPPTEPAPAAAFNPSADGVNASWARARSAAQAEIVLPAERLLRTAVLQLLRALPCWAYVWPTAARASPR